MAVAEPTGPALTREEVDRALARLGAEHEAVESSLLALQDHAGRRLLEGAELTGETSSRWAAAEALIGQLWAYFDAYTAALTAARELRARRRWPTQGELSELTELLRGSGITLPGHGTAVLGTAGLTGAAAGPAGAAGMPARLSEHLSLQELLDRMNGWYAQALDVVVIADAVWSALPARIDLLAAELGRTRSLAHSVGVRPGEHPAGDDLEQITRELAALREEVISDPVVFWAGGPPSSAPGGGRPDTTRYDRAARALEDVRREVEAVLDVRQDAEQRLMRVRDVLSRADRTLNEARQARIEVLSKIAASVVPAVSGPPTALYEQLSAAAEHRRHARWHRLSPLLEGLEQRAEEELLRARESLTAVTAPLAVRAELRGRLDAYKAKTARHGLAEDSLLIERYDAARRMLWSAPCDLMAAEQAVLRYQQALAEALSAPSGTGEQPTGRRGEA
ncbi:hypothetical protein [Streptomyces hiroshimensis]|uniref:Uncharacterized protein n=1 Tax=Streptomyces hiroshimensis TaxID=66424 RepID=A0ABQ2Y6U1_9ACTN|nr:hypothetical protein [Streptomyces hiroshimensis]GGX70038.1 hypothetical protein GCM10010324_13790 [Streptomyces hiroshimensis]